MELLLESRCWLCSKSLPVPTGHVWLGLPWRRVLPKWSWASSVRRCIQRNWLERWLGSKWLGVGEDVLAVGFRGDYFPTKIYHRYIQYMIYIYVSIYIYVLIFTYKVIHSGLSAHVFCGLVFPKRRAFNLTQNASEHWRKDSKALHICVETHW